MSFDVTYRTIWERPLDVLLPSRIMLFEFESFDFPLPVRPNLVPKIIFTSISI